MAIGNVVMIGVMAMTPVHIYYRAEAVEEDGGPTAQTPGPA